MSERGGRSDTGYVLGVDLGTTFTAAAIAREGRPEIVPLGDHAPQIPSAVFLTESGDYLIGDVAIRRGQRDPGRLATEFKRRLGDDTNIVVGATPISAHALMAQLLAGVVDHVTRSQGNPPATVVITHPANWGPYRLELLGQAARMAALPHVTLCPEPEAAAIHFASNERVEPGQTVAVYDLGGGTFDAAVLRKNTTTGFTVLGTPEGIEHLGGLDFDAAVLHHVRESIGTLDIDPDDPATLTALTRLARDCTEAKEALSSDTDVTIPVTLAVTTAVRLSRPEFEEAIRPSLDETISSMQRALDSSGATADDLSAIVLIGGSSRIPLVTHLLTEQFNRPIALSPQPKHAVALGATLTASDTPVREAAAAQSAAHISTPTAPNKSPKTAVLIGAGILALAAMMFAILSAIFNSSEPSADQAPADPAAATNEAPQPVTLTMAQFGNADYADLLNEYHDIYPHITIELRGADPGRPGGSAARDRLIAGTSTADIELVRDVSLPTLTQYPDRFKDLSSPDLRNRWWVGTTREATTAGGALIGYGTNLGPMAVCYRADLLRDAGMPTDPEAVADLVGESWESYFDAGRQFVAASDAAWYDSSGGILDGMINQRDTAYEDENGRIIVEDSGDLRELYDQILTASVSDGLSAGQSRGGTRWSESLQRDDYVTVLCPAETLAEIEAGSAGTGEWNIAPTFPGGTGGYRGGLYLTVPATADHAPEAISLAAWLTAPEQQVKVFASTGLFPSQRQAWESEALLGVKNPYFSDAPVGEIFAQQAKLLNDPPFRGKHHYAIHDLLKDAIYRVDIDGTDSADGSWETFLTEVGELE